MARLARVHPGHPSRLPARQRPTGTFGREYRFSTSDLPNLSSPKSKNIPLSISVNQNYNRPTSSPRRGVGRRHCTLGWVAVDAAASCALEVAGRDEPREQFSGASDGRCLNASVRTSAGTWLVGGVAEGRLRKSFGGPVPNPAKPLGEDGSCVRRSRVVLASVADVKSAEVHQAQPGLIVPLIRGRR